MKLTQILREIALKENEELAQAIKKATNLSVKSVGPDGKGNDGIFFYDKIEWDLNLKTEILPILQGEFGKDAKFEFNDYDEGETSYAPGEKGARLAHISIILPKKKT
jgi:hypothetical protein